MLRRMLRPTLSPSPRVAVLGDSVTKQWFLQLLGILEPCIVTRDFADDRPRHSMLRFMDFEQAANSEWIPPVAGVEGPTVFKAPMQPFMTMLGCDDGGCSHDYAQSWQCGRAATTSVEYLPVEFARDVEFPVLAGPASGRTSTTQASVGMYLARSPRDLCLVNSGLHDAQLGQRELFGQGNLTDEQYVRNVADYITALQPGCRKIVWMATTAVCGQPLYPQKNADIKIWNAKVLQLLRTRFPEVSWVDLFHMSQGPEVSLCSCVRDCTGNKVFVGDNVHKSAAFSAAVASIVASALTPTPE